MEKFEKVHILVAVVLFDTTVHSNSTTMIFSVGQGHLVTLAKGHVYVVCGNFQRTSSLKLLSQFHLNFVRSLLAKEERNFIYFVQVTWLRWPSCLYYVVKTLKNLLS